MRADIHAFVVDEPTAGLDPKERVRFRNLISDFAKEKIVILSTHIVSDVSYIADYILMMKDGQFLLGEPMETVTDGIRGKVWEFLADDREAAEYSRRFSIVNLHHENNMVRLRIVSDTAPTPEARTVTPSLEDLFLYYFGEDSQNFEDDTQNFRDDIQNFKDDTQNFEDGTQNFRDDTQNFRDDAQSERSSDYVNKI